MYVGPFLADFMEVGVHGLPPIGDRRRRVEGVCELMMEG